MPYASRSLDYWLCAHRSQFPDSTYPNATDTGYDSGDASGETSPPFYPSPWGEGLGDWAAAYTQARAFVSGLTLTEKVNLTTGEQRAPTNAIRDERR